MTPSSGLPGNHHEATRKLDNDNKIIGLQNCFAGPLRVPSRSDESSSLRIVAASKELATLIRNFLGVFGLGNH